MASSKTPTGITKRRVQIALGLLWLLDAGLQYQHQMFTANFANDVIAPAGQGQLGIISGPIHLAVRITLTHPAVFNAFFATIQLVIAVLILNRRTVKAGLIGSVIWGLIVWYMGEGLGGLLSGQTTLLMGLPGAALLYAIISLAIMPSANSEKKDETERPAYWLPIAWAILWVGGAVYILLPGRNATSQVSSMVAGMADGAPGWLASLDTHAANLLRGQGFWLIALLAALQLIVGLLIFLPGRCRRVAVSAGIIFSLIFWVIGQNLGEYYSGLATDPSTAPLFILLGVAILGCTSLTFKKLRRAAAHDLERLSI